MREIFRRYARGGRVDREDRTVAHRAGRADPDRHDGLEQRHDLGDAPQPGLRRAGGLRQDARDRRAVRADASSAPARAALRPDLAASTSRPRTGSGSRCPRSSARSSSRSPRSGLQRNSRLSPRNTRRPSLLQGILVCRECGYAYYRCSTRSKNGKLREYYRCSGTDGHRRPEGRVCANRPVRLAEVDELVWTRVLALLEDPDADPGRNRPPAPDDARDAPRHQPTRRARARPHPRAERAAPTARRLPGAADHARGAPRPHARAAQTRGHGAGRSWTRSTPSCTTPRPTSSSPRRSTASAPGSPPTPRA